MNRKQNEVGKKQLKSIVEYSNLKTMLAITLYRLMGLQMTFSNICYVHTIIRHNVTKFGDPSSYGLRD